LTLRPSDGVAYRASETGVFLGSWVVAERLAAARVRVNAIAAGPIGAPLAHDVHAEQARPGSTGPAPQRHEGSRAEFAEAAPFCLSLSSR
jgi:NAD(P)-dependent dehydrogenase (short-subunit alcohol dehydrogenase family)